MFSTSGHEVVDYTNIFALLHYTLVGDLSPPFLVSSIVLTLCLCNLHFISAALLLYYQISYYPLKCMQILCANSLTHVTLYNVIV